MDWLCGKPRWQFTCQRPSSKDQQEHTYCENSWVHYPLWPWKAVTTENHWCLNKRILLFNRSVISYTATPCTAAPQVHCPSPAPGAGSNSCPSSQWCHSTISSSVVPFSSCFQSFPASGSFPVSQLFASGGQSIGVSASASVLPMNIQDWSPLGWTGWISLQFKGLSRVFSNTTIPKHQFFGAQPFLWSNSHIHTWQKP